MIFILLDKENTRFSFKWKLCLIIQTQPLNRVPFDSLFFFTLIFGLQFCFPSADHYWLTRLMMFLCLDEELKGCYGTRDCLGAEGVLRVSLGCFVSFIKIRFIIVGSIYIELTEKQFCSHKWNICKFSFPWINNGSIAKYWLRICIVELNENCAWLYSFQTNWGCLVTTLQALINYAV